MAGARRFPRLGILGVSRVANKAHNAGPNGFIKSLYAPSSVPQNSGSWGSRLYPGKWCVLLQSEIGSSLTALCRDLVLGRRVIVGYGPEMRRGE